jgi:peptidoglycan/LPS O-acetylase OafA/YrhL
VLAVRDRTPGAFRADIQAMRALAVGGVVLNHLWPGRLTGGYVGVDVFFVISGYLISLHLLRELGESGRIDLLAFYGRRIRRLLPAALLVIVAGLLGMVAFAPATVWDRNVSEALASTFYVENFQLVRLSVDYMAHDQAASAFQHYWSLSVEEQFYLVWPAVLLGSLLLARRVAKGRSRVRSGGLPGGSGRVAILAPVAVGVLTIVLGSLAVATVQTNLSPTAAYFFTWTRAWEFGAGALAGVLALSRGGRSIVDGRSATVVAGAGWLAMAVAMVLFDVGTAVPGPVALLPVLGAVAVIVAGEGPLRAPLAGLTGWRPVQVLGDISYSVYLWHWPFIVLLPYLTSSHGLATRVIALVATGVAAWATRRFVEIPAQRAAVLRRGRLRVFAATAVAMMVVSGGVAAISAEGRQRETAAGQRLEQAQGTSACFGAAALDPSCHDPYKAGLLSPVSSADKQFTPGAPCVTNPALVVQGFHPRVDCDFSQRPGALRVWLLGDSHGQHYMPALAEAARLRHWDVTGITIGGCAPFLVKQAPGAIPGRSEDVCPVLGPEIDKAVRSARPDVIVISVSSRRERLDDGTGHAQEVQYRSAINATVRPWIDAGAVVLVMTDNPSKTGVLDSQCTNEHLDDLAACAVPRSDIVTLGPLERAVDSLAPSMHGLGRIDLIDHVCDRTTCRSVVGGVNVLHDTNHFSAVYSRTLGPYLAAEILRRLPKS